MIWPAAMIDELARGRDRVRTEIARAEGSIRSERSTSLELRSRVLALRGALCEYTDLEDELMPYVLKALGEWGDDQIGSMWIEHANRRIGLESAVCDLEALGDWDDPGDVYGMTDALVHLGIVVRSALDAEQALLRRATDRTDDMNYNGSGG
jgi:hypothetical protein